MPCTERAFDGPSPCFHNVTISRGARGGLSAMPRQAMSRTRTTAAPVPAAKTLSDGRMPAAIRTTLQGAEALSVGLVHAVTETVVTAVRGVQEVGAEIGTTALSAVRGSIRAGREVGGEVGRVAVGAAQGAAHAVQRAGVGAARMVGFSVRRPLQRIERPRRRRARRASAA